jgi:hypothetical protein
MFHAAVLLLATLSLGLVCMAQALISFDDASGNYRMRAFNDGRWLETELRLADGGNTITWGFALGDMKTSSVLRLNETGEWTELATLTIGTRPTQKLMDLTVRRISGR